jgi:hypothetical protein
MRRLTSRFLSLEQANADVIFTIQAGFIGTWAEWYYTDYYGGVGNSYVRAQSHHSSIVY